MFLQIRIPLHERNALRFLWKRENSNEIETFRMTSHLFGGCFCSASSTYALRKITELFHMSDATRTIILKSFYVDDLLHSCPTLMEARSLISESREVLRLGGFNLRSFVVNDSDLTDVTPVDEVQNIEKSLLTDEYNRALGITWKARSDRFSYVWKHSELQEVVTRRSLLSKVSSLFDPIGLVSPLILRGKYLFQSATRLKLSWDIFIIHTNALRPLLVTR